VTYPDGSQISYGYGSSGTVTNLMSPLTSITDSGINGSSPVASYSYIGAGTLVTENYGLAQVKLDYTPTNFAAWDQFGRILDQVCAAYGSNNGGTLDGYQYIYDGDGNRLTQTNLTNGSLNNQFKCDALDRLYEWDQGSPYVEQEGWTLDSLGNDLSGSKSYDLSNEEGSTSNYDLAGNMIVLASGDGAVYDAWGRLVKATSGASTLETCQYDGLNRRTQVVAGGTTTNDYYAGQQMVQSNVTGGAGYEYVWSPRYIDAPIVRSALTTGQNGIQANTQYYFLGDANYNVTALLNSTGAVVEHYSYTPYGVVSYYDTVGSNAWTSTSSSGNANTILYSGRQLDTAISLYYCRARYYDPSMQRFVSQDPIGYTTLCIC
jgi:RHS repeat-associated protein